MIKLDLDAPIVPFQGLGGIKLYSTREDLKELLERQDGTVIRENWGAWWHYEIKGCFCLFFHKRNNKLWKIITEPEYRGKLFGKIGTETSSEDLLKLDPSFVYDDFEEVYESKKGIFIQDDCETRKCAWISVFVRELLEDEDDSTGVIGNHP